MWKLWEKFLALFGMLEQSANIAEKVVRYGSAVFWWGAGMGVIAVFTEWLNAYAPFSWAVAVAFGFLVSLTILALNAKYQLWSSQRRLIELSGESSVNPMRTTFENERIDIRDIVHPLTKVIENKTFTNCEIIGPAIVVFTENSTIGDCSFRNCDFYRMRSDRPTTIYNSIQIRDTRFIGCELFVLTFVAQEDFAQHLDAMGVEWVTSVSR